MGGRGYLSRVPISKILGEGQCDKTVLTHLFYKRVKIEKTRNEGTKRVLGGGFLCPLDPPLIS